MIGLRRSGGWRAGVASSVAAALVAVAGFVAAGGTTASAAPRCNNPCHGIDVSNFSGSVNWHTVAGSNQFAYILATQGTYFTDPLFAADDRGALSAGLIRGGFHFADPTRHGGSPAAQADYFVAHGGGWKADSHTLPGALDIESRNGVATCYGLSQGAMVSWIRAWLDEYHHKTGRWAPVFTDPSWWRQCTGNSGAFRSTSPLWISDWGVSHPDTLAWGGYTIWQDAGGVTVAGVQKKADRDVFNGDGSRLLALANNG